MPQLRADFFVPKRRAGINFAPDEGGLVLRLRVLVKGEIIIFMKVV